MGYRQWFEELLAEFGHELVVGGAAKIRKMEVRKQQHDRRDAEHLLNLLLRGDFPKIGLPSAAERDARVWLEHRHQLVQVRTRTRNGLQAVALNHGRCLRQKRWTKGGQKELKKLPRREGRARRRADLLALRAQLDRWIEELDKRIEQEVAQRPDAQRGLPHPGVGPLTALGTGLILRPVERFPDAQHVTSYGGLIPQEESSGGRQHFGRLTKQGNGLLRFLLVEAGPTASRLDPGLRRAYRRLTFRKGRASAKGAVARKLAIRRYLMLRAKIDYEEFCRRGSPAGMLGEVALA